MSEWTSQPPTKPGEYDWRIFRWCSDEACGSRVYRVGMTTVHDAGPLGLLALTRPGHYCAPENFQPDFGFTYDSPVEWREAAAPKEGR